MPQQVILHKDITYIDPGDDPEQAYLNAVNGKLSAIKSNGSYTTGYLAAMPATPAALPQGGVNRTVTSIPQKTVQPAQVTVTQEPTQSSVTPSATT